MKIVVLSGAVLLLIAGGWVWYALSIPEQTLADEGRCVQPMRVKAVNATRHLLGAKTSSEIDESRPNFHEDVLRSGAKYSCAY